MLLGIRSRQRVIATEVARPRQSAPYPLTPSLRKQTHAPSLSVRAFIRCNGARKKRENWAERVRSQALQLLRYGPVIRLSESGRAAFRVNDARAVLTARDEPVGRGGINIRRKQRERICRLRCTGVAACSLLDFIWSVVHAVVHGKLSVLRSRAQWGPALGNRREETGMH